MYRLRLRSFNNAKTNQAALTIQVWFKYRQRARANQGDGKQERALTTIKRWLRQVVRMRPVNEVDPITLEPPTPPVFKHFNSTGKLNAFDARNLAAYFRATGNFIHPVTREPFTRIDVLRLQNLLPPEERTLLDQIPELEAQRDAALQHDADLRVAETATQLILDQINELSLVARVPSSRQLRVLYTILMPDLLLLIASVAYSYGQEHAQRLIDTSLVWLDAQQGINLTTLTNAPAGFNLQHANSMIVVLETTRGELLRIASDMQSLQVIFSALQTARGGTPSSTSDHGLVALIV